jgi:exosortase D (VPLPA-CTERM-specific)
MDAQTADHASVNTQSQTPWLLWGLLLAAFGLLGFVFYDGLALMVTWWERDEYSHGYMIPLVALFLIYQRQQGIPERVGKGAWLAVPALIFGVFLFFLGELSAIYTVIQYGFLLSFYAIVAAFFGWRTTFYLWAALAYLIFMIPLPNFLYNNLSSELQLISSAIGVAVVRAFDISVFLEGNVIDLGSYKLQVVEACSGLRYLFPLMSFGFLIAYLYRGPFWQKAVLFLSTMPITVLMNSFRIGVIGVTVEHWGIEMAEGFLHDFEGWVIFMGCLGVLVIEMWLFHLFTKDGQSLWDRIDLDLPEKNIALSDIKLSWQAQTPFLVCLAVLASAAVAVPLLDSREEVVMERDSFNSFPLYHSNWRGREGAIEAEVLDELKLTDYIKADYLSTSSPLPVNFYVAYYDSQRKGSSIHSPRSCIPGGGWQLTDLRQEVIEGVTSREGKPLTVNRVLIRKDEAAQVVYYWFEQRSRNVTNEYLAKWYIFWDSMTLNRTDGALVRVVVPVPTITEIEASETLGQQFIKDFYPQLIRHLPATQQ